VDAGVFHVFGNGVRDDFAVVGHGVDIDFTAAFDEFR
jgi:hypothetical protein